MTAERVGEGSSWITGANIDEKHAHSVVAGRDFVADGFVGVTDTDGTSTMAELGLGVQHGGWGFTIGANWLDGGAYDSTVSGQASLRFAW